MHIKHKGGSRNNLSRGLAFRKHLHLFPRCSGTPLDQNVQITSNPGNRNGCWLKSQGTVWALESWSSRISLPKGLSRSLTLVFLICWKQLFAKVLNQVTGRRSGASYLQTSYSGPAGGFPGRYLKSSFIFQLVV